MKKTNVAAVVAVIVAVAVVAVVVWLLSRPADVTLQGEADATSYKASSKIAGRIERMMVREGQQVHRGDLLYVLATPEVDARMRQARAAESAAAAQDRKAGRGARAEEIEAARSLWQTAEAGLTLAEKTYRRVQNLYAEGVVAAQKYDEAEANYKAMQAQTAAARAQYDMALDGARREDRESAAALVDQAAGVVSEVEAAAVDSHIYSPVDGEVSTVIAREGELVAAGFPVVTIVDTEDIWVAYNVKETLMPRIRQGMRLVAWVPALDRDVEFEVDYIAVQADFATWSATRTRGDFDVRTFNVRTRPVGPAGGLRPGMSAILNWTALEKGGEE